MVSGSGTAWLAGGLSGRLELQLAVAAELEVGAGRVGTIAGVRCVPGVASALIPFFWPLG